MSMRVMRHASSAGTAHIHFGWRYAFAVYRWIIDPAKHTKWNVQAGLGLKLPTGDYRYQDYFVKNDSVKVLGPVDQSIQLGDGGTGITAEINAFFLVSPVS